MFVNQIGMFVNYSQPKRCFGLGTDRNIQGGGFRLFNFFIWGFTSLSTLYRSYHEG